MSTFQVVPTANELGWRSLFGAWYFEDAIKVRHNLTIRAGIRHEFTTGWNEATGRAANYITDANGVLLTAPRVGNSVFTQNQRQETVRPEGRAGVGPVREREDGGPRRVRDVLFADRRSQLPAEFAAAL